MPSEAQERFEAVSPTGAPVALEFLHEQVVAEPGFGNRFPRLVRARATLTHPNLATVLGWGAVEHCPYLAMELRRSPTLAELLSQGPVDAAEAVRLLHAVADALELACARGLVDRTLTPETIMVDARNGGHPLLGDLGITKPRDPRVLVELCGVEHYASPELLRGEPAAPESHVYSLACILCECLTGHPPYPFDRRRTPGYAHLAEPPPVLTERRSDLPTAIDAVFATAMAAEPRDRFPSATAFTRASADVLGVRAPSRPPSFIRPTAQGGPALPSPKWTEPFRGIPKVSPGQASRAPSRPRGTARKRVGRPGFRAGIALAATIPVVAAGGAGYLAGNHETSLSSPSGTGHRSAAGGRRLAAIQAVERLQARRLAGRRALAAARQPPAQAAAARDLASAYRWTRSKLVADAGAPALRPGLRDAQRAYRSLAAAAQRGDRADYAAAAQAVHAAERLLANELRVPGT